MIGKGPVGKRDLGAGAFQERSGDENAKPEPGVLDLGGAHQVSRRGRDVEVIVSGNPSDVLDRLRARSPEAISTESLSLEEIFVATLQPGGAVA